MASVRVRIIAYIHPRTHSTSCLRIWRCIGPPREDILGISIVFHDVSWTILGLIKTVSHTRRGNPKNRSPNFWHIEKEETWGGAKSEKLDLTWLVIAHTSRMPIEGPIYRGISPLLISNSWLQANPQKVSEALKPRTAGPIWCSRLCCLRERTKLTIER